MLASYNQENQRQWEVTRDELLDEESHRFWLEQWAGYVSLREEAETMPAPPYEKVLGLETQVDSYIDSFEKTIIEDQDVRGFLVAVDHPNKDVRVDAVYSIRHVWHADKGLAKAALARLAHDDLAIVRQLALEEVMIMLYGDGRDSWGEPLDLEDSDFRALQAIMADAIRDINQAVGA